MVKKAEGVEAKIEKLVKALEGKLGKFTEMGKKQLAYPIAKTREAIFLNWVVEIPEAGVVQLTKKLTIDKEILRHLCLRVR